MYCFAPPSTPPPPGPPALLCSALSVDAKLKFGKLREILLLVTVHCSDLFVLRKSSDREEHPSLQCSVRGGPAISPAILNTRLLKVPCTQRMKRLICGPLTARRALSLSLSLHSRFRPPNSTDTSNRRSEGPWKCLIMMLWIGEHTNTNVAEIFQKNCFHQHCICVYLWCESRVK